MIDPLAVALQGAGTLPLLYATDGFLGQTPEPPIVDGGGGGWFNLVHHRAAKKVVKRFQSDMADDDEIIRIVQVFVDEILGA